MQPAQVSEGVLETYFETEKDTPGTRKFKEVKGEGRPPIGNMYITKEFLQEIGNPSNVKVTIEPA